MLLNIFGANLHSLSFQLPNLPLMWIQGSKDAGGAYDTNGLAHL
jgi:hypothetical protein